MIEMTIIPCRAGLPFGGDTSQHVLVKVTQRGSLGSAPPRRLPLNLALVIDRSGSMAGRPLEEAKRCGSMVLDALDEADRLAIVAYDQRAEVCFPSVLVTDKAAIRASIDSIRSGGSTDLHGGWVAGAGEVVQFAVDSGVSRVLLLSDGCANVGVTAPSVITRHCGEMAAQKITTSTYGLGAGFNEDLMTEMARAGQGQAHYGRTADDLSDPFLQELDMLRALVARDLRLHLTPASGVRATVLNRYQFEELHGTFRLPDLAEGAEVWALVRLDIDEGAMHELGSTVRLVSASLSFMGSDGGYQKCDPVESELNVVSPDVHDAMSADDQVVARLREVTVAGLADEARLAARRRDWDRVDVLTTRMLEEAGNHEWVIRSVNSLRAFARDRDLESFSKEAHYKSNTFRNRMSRPDDASTEWSEAEEAMAPSYLRKKTEEGRRFNNQTLGSERPRR